MTGGIDKTKLNQSQDADVSTFTTFIPNLTLKNLVEADICIFVVNILPGKWAKFTMKFRSLYLSFYSILISMNIVSR